MRPRASSALALAIGMIAARPAAAQGIGQGYELERTGKLPQAVELYRGVLRGDSTNLPALLGLERVLSQLGRLPELVPLAQQANRVSQERDPQLLGLELRTFVALSMNDSVAALARRWTARVPGDETPWREWAVAQLDQQNVVEARRILLEGRKAVGDPRAFAIELAEIAASTADWAMAAQDWADAVTTDAGQIANAVVQLESAPDVAHHTVTDALLKPQQSVSARRLGANLLLDWGQGDQGWILLEGTLMDSSRETVMALWSFAQRAEQLGTPVAEGARGHALARFADLSVGALAARARTDAARALLAAGDKEGAHQLVAQIQAQSGVPTTALVDVLIGDGDLDQAEQQLAGSHLSADDAVRIRLELSRAWTGRGELARAGRVLGGDSSIDAVAQRGWIALYHGDVARARDAFQEAGPYAGDRSDATRRTEMLALITDVDSSQGTKLGPALLALARGDSGAAVDGLRAAALGLAPGPRGGVLVLAGRVAATLDSVHQALAAELFRQVVADSLPRVGAAPAAAELEWARLLERQGKPDRALAHLEHLILAYPGSAVVPEARRMMDRLKGSVPRS
jgi:tetratricopeptide (TPR) repeat protein